MGIDYSDIENVIHCGAPSTIEQYIQETALLYDKVNNYGEETMSGEMHIQSRLASCDNTCS